MLSTSLSTFNRKFSSNCYFPSAQFREAIMKLIALGFKIYLKEKWNQLDVAIVILSVVGIVLEELETNIIPINPTIIRVMRVMRIARVLKLLKMAKGIRALLDTVMQALPQVRLSNGLRDRSKMTFTLRGRGGGQIFRKRTHQNPERKVICFY